MIQTPIAEPTVEEIEAAMEGYTITGRRPDRAVAPAPVEVGYVTFATPDTASPSRFYGALFGWADRGRQRAATSTPTSPTPSCRWA